MYNVKTNATIKAIFETFGVEDTWSGSGSLWTFSEAVLVKATDAVAYADDRLATLLASLSERADKELTAVENGEQGWGIPAQTLTDYVTLAAARKIAIENLSFLVGAYKYTLARDTATA